MNTYNFCYHYICLIIRFAKLNIYRDLFTMKKKKKLQFNKFEVSVVLIKPLQNHETFKILLKCLKNHQKQRNWSHGGESLS